MNALSAPAGLRRLHGRPHAHDGRRGEAAGPHEAVPRHRREAEGEDRPFHAGRARRLARPRRGVPGALRGAALLVRPQGRSLRRPRQRVRSGRRASERTQLAWLESDLAKRKADAPVVILTHRPLFDLYPAVGLGHEGRRGSARDPRAVPARDRLLRAHPPGAPPQDGPHRAPLGHVIDVPAPGARLGPEEGARSPGTTSSRTAASRGATSKPIRRRARIDSRRSRSRQPKGAAPVAKAGLNVRFRMRWEGTAARPGRPSCRCGRARRRAPRREDLRKEVLVHARRGARQERRGRRSRADVRRSGSRLQPSRVQDPEGHRPEGQSRGSRSRPTRRGRFRSTATSSAATVTRT